MKFRKIQFVKWIVKFLIVRKIVCCPESKIYFIKQIEWYENTKLHSTSYCLDKYFATI